MAQEPKLSHTRPGQKRQQTVSLYPSNCDLDYELYKDDLPYRCWPRRSIPLSPLHQRDLPKQVRAKRCTKSVGIYEYQKIPPLIGHIPIKIRRSHLGTESKIRLSPHRDLRSNSNPTTGRTKLRAEELHSIKGELSQIKAQVDNLLESLNRMDQQREHPTGAKERERKPFAGMDASYPAGELTRMKGSVRNEGQAPQQEVNSAEESTDTEEAAVKNHTPDPEGSK